MSSLGTYVKLALIKAGAGRSSTLESFSQLLRFAEWARTAKLPDSPPFPDRFSLYEHCHRAGEPVDYLEFGVHRGASIRRWSEMNDHPDSRFYGFDSFEGLPEDWDNTSHRMKAGHFSTSGVPPDIRDPRVSFVKGWFQDSLPGFLAGFTARNRLVVNLDADLYSSTLYVLAALHPLLKPGSVLIFDEFSFVNHEFRAFQDFTASFPVRLEIAGHCDEFFLRVAFRAV